MPVNDARLVQVVGGHFNIDLVTNADTDEILPHFAGNMGQNFMAIRQRHPEHGAGEHLCHAPA